MKNIASFDVDHLRLKRGIYLSRLDSFENTVLSTFDIRMKEPNNEPVMDIPALHTIEHIGATFLRNHAKYQDKTVYFGPMGCRTGFYAIFAHNFTSNDVLPVIAELFKFVEHFEGKIPGCSAKECGNWRDHNLDMAKYESKKFLNEILNNAKKENLVYPE